MSINNNILIYLKKYSSDVNKVNLLITSAFCNFNHLKVENNLLLKNLIISKNNDAELKSLLEFSNLFYANNQIFDFECLIELF